MGRECKLVEDRLCSLNYHQIHSLLETSFWFCFPITMARTPIFTVVNDQKVSLFSFSVSKKRKVRDVRIAESCSDNDLAELLRRLDLFDKGEDFNRIVRKVVLSKTEINRALCVPDKFQLIPLNVAPERDPVLNGFMPMPAILEVCVTTLYPEIYDRFSAERSFRQIELFINLMFNWGICAPTKENVWSTDVFGTVNSLRRSITNDFLCPGSTPDSFSKISGFEKFEIDSSDKYYSSYPTTIVGMDYGNSIGSDFFDLFQKFENLENRRKQEFVISCYWFQYAQRVHPVSLSAAFMALVQTIESLITDSPDVNWCQVSNAGEGLTSKFRKFMAQFGGGTAIEKFSLYYNQRSRIAHGDAIFEIDESYLHGWADHGRQRQLFEDLYVETRLALRNWLASVG